MASGDLDHAEEELKRIDEIGTTPAPSSRTCGRTSWTFAIRSSCGRISSPTRRLRRRGRSSRKRRRRRSNGSSGSRRRTRGSPRRCVSCGTGLPSRTSARSVTPSAAARKRVSVQRNKEQRRRDLQQAVERIRGYLDREELSEAAAALEAAEATLRPRQHFPGVPRPGARGRAKAAGGRYRTLGDRSRTEPGRRRRSGRRGAQTGNVRARSSRGRRRVLEALRREQQRQSRPLSPARPRAAVAVAAPPRAARRGGHGRGRRRVALARAWRRREMEAASLTAGGRRPRPAAAARRFRRANPDIAHRAAECPCAIPTSPRCRQANQPARQRRPRPSVLSPRLFLRLQKPFPRRRL